MNATQSPVVVERRNKPSYTEFTEEFLFPRKPVVITGALDKWKAVSTWTPQMFKDKYGSKPLLVDGQEHTLGGFVPAKTDGKPFTMGEFIDLVLSSNDQKPSPYLRNVHIEKFLPELYSDIQPVPEYLSPNWIAGPLAQPLYSRLHGGRPELYVGGTGGKFPVLHWDTWHIHTFLCQVYGSKKYTLFAPEQGPFLYPNGNSSAVRDPENVDLEKFPLFAKASPIGLLLQPAEILFVPAGWWHTTRILSPSITISMSRVNASNWKDFSRDLTQGAPSFLRPPLGLYLTALRAVHALAGS